MVLCVCVCVCIAFESFDDMLLRQCISRSRERLTFYIISPPRALDTSGIPRKTVETKARPHAPNSKGTLYKSRRRFTEIEAKNKIHCMNI